MSTAQKLYAQAEKERKANEKRGEDKGTNPVDPYMTFLGYFNTIKELGISRRLLEEEVTSLLTTYDQRRRLNETKARYARRKIANEPLELTSRVPTSEVSTTKARLELSFDNEKQRVDTALATNMISVGLDISRLGLMVMLGQPKTTAEYIQASSRVGRDDQRPGLVVVLLNPNRPRDRSHYERFSYWHSVFIAMWRPPASRPGRPGPWTEDCRLSPWHWPGTSAPISPGPRMPVSSTPLGPSRLRWPSVLAIGPAARHRARPSANTPRPKCASG